MFDYEREVAGKVSNLTLFIYSFNDAPSNERRVSIEEIINKINRCRGRYGIIHKIGRLWKHDNQFFWIVLVSWVYRSDDGQSND